MGFGIKKMFCSNGMAYIWGILLFGITFNSFIYTYCFSVNIKMILLFMIIEYMVFLLIGLHYKKQFFVAPYFWFISFYMLYSSVFPFLLEFGGLTYYGAAKESVEYTVLFGYRFLCVMMFIFSLLHSCYIPNVTKDNIKILKRNDEDILILSFVVLLMVLYCFMFGGFYQFILAHELVRTNLKNYVADYGIWTFIGYLNIYLYIYLLIYFKGISKIKRCIITAPILLYFLVCMFTGSRKYILFLLVITLCCTILEITQTKRIFFIVVAAVLMATFMRVIVMDRGFSGDIYTKISSMTGEFIFPYITFPLSVQKGISGLDFNYPTILDSVLYFIPRKIFTLKNYSIGYTFSYRFMNVGMGFASTPLLEGYINFGNLGYLFEALLIGGLLFYTTRKANKDFFLFLFTIIFLIDLNRGEISHYIRQLIIISAMVYFIKGIIKKWRLKFLL